MEKHHIPDKENAESSANTKEDLYNDELGKYKSLIQELGYAHFDND